jgi:hypothetical protein
MHKHFGLSVENIEWFVIEAAVKDEAWLPFTDSVRQRLRQSAVNLGLEPKDAA